MLLQRMRFSEWHVGASSVKHANAVMCLVQRRGATCGQLGPVSLAKHDFDMHVSAAAC